MTRGVVALIVLALAIGACGGQPTTTAQPTASAPPTPTAQLPSGQPTHLQTQGPTTPTSPPSPTTTGQPPATDFPGPDATPAPLPEPALTTVDDITQAMGVPGAGEQVAVSTLALLGIGLYQPDGTPIRVGSEQSDSDLYLVEPEARGLAHLFEAQFQEDGWIDFRDFHAVLAQYGYTGTAEDLAGEYQDLFAAQPDDPMTQLVGYVDVDAPVTKFAAWLLFVDGFVRHHDQAARQPAMAKTSSRGIAQLGGGLIMDATTLAHLMLVAATTVPSLTFAMTQVHEGHGVPGAPDEIKATVRAVAVAWVSPFTGASLIPIQAITTDGIGVNFAGNRAITKHGELSDTTATTDQTGEATIAYTPRIEPAGGVGVVVSTLGVVAATANMTDVMTRLYGQPALAVFATASGVGIGQLMIEWHDEPPMLIDFTNTYNLKLPHEVMGSAQTSGKDYIQGNLIVDEDDPTRWEGTALAYAQGTFSGELFGKSCTSSWDVQQILQVTALEDLGGSGETLFVFQPLTEPLGDMGNPTCNTSRPPTPDGLIWAPFNDLGVTDPGIGLRFNTAIPRPGFFETDYPAPLAGTGVTGSANWHVRIEFATP